MPAWRRCNFRGPNEADLSIVLDLPGRLLRAGAVLHLALERGGGRFVVTASAAGLLTMLGDLSYSVTKHGAVAFAEWLSATYRHRGIVVQAISPQGLDQQPLGLHASG